MLENVVKLYCNDDFADKVSASIQLNDLGASVKTVGVIEFKKNANLERTVICIDKFVCNDEVCYVAVDFRKTPKGDRKFLKDTKVVEFFVKKTLLKSCSCWSFKDEEFRRAVENYIDNM